MTHKTPAQTRINVAHYLIGLAITELREATQMTDYHEMGEGFAVSLETLQSLIESIDFSGDPTHLAALAFDTGRTQNESPFILSEEAKARLRAEGLYLPVDPAEWNSPEALRLRRIRAGYGAEEVELSEGTIERFGLHRSRDRRKDFGNIAIVYAPDSGFTPAPCGADCDHINCSMMRDWVGRTCGICGKPIGYGRQYRDYGVAGVEHEDCFIEALKATPL